MPSPNADDHGLVCPERVHVAGTRAWGDPSFPNSQVSKHVRLLNNTGNRWKEKLFLCSRCVH